MTVYLVRVQAVGLRATLESSEGIYDLLKNEYVWANSDRAAIEKAKHNVREALRRRPSIDKQQIDKLPLIVDEIKSNQSLICLFKRQGFVFCPTAGQEVGE